MRYLIHYNEPEDGDGAVTNQRIAELTEGDVIPWNEGLHQFGPYDWTGECDESNTETIKTFARADQILYSDGGNWKPIP